MTRGPLSRIAVISVHGCPVARLGEKDTGGMNVYVLQTAKELGCLGLAVDVYTRYHDPKDPQVVPLGPNARVIHLEAGPYQESKQSLYYHLPTFLRNLQCFIEAQGVSYQLLHTHYWLSGGAGLVLARQWDVPHVASFHTLAEVKRRARVGEQEPELRVREENRVIAGADLLLAFSHHEKDAMVRFYDASPHAIQVLPAGVDTELFSPLDQEACKRELGLEGRSVVLFVGRIEPLKGVDLLLRAVAQLEEGGDVQVLVVGGSPGRDRELNRLQRLGRELGIGERVHFTGSVKQEQLPRYYSAADVCVLPSYYESFGLVALEAMACGTPVIASRVGGLPTVVRDGETGYLVPWRCPEPYVQRLEMLLCNASLRRGMGAAAHRRAQGMSWSRVAQGLLPLYSSLANPAWSAAVGG